MDPGTEALRGLLIRHLPSLEARVRARAGPFVRARESCSDLVQSICVAALRDLDGFEFRGEPAFRRWLFELADHRIVNKAEFHRAARRDAARERRPASGTTSGGAAPAGHHSTTPSRHAIRREAASRLEDALRRLPPPYREAVTLHRVEQLPYPEIAAILGRTEASVRTLVSRGLVRLSALLGPAPGVSR
jgi:RNA polymerase sigma-70 factor (ECF subfamily)